jgi:hypothetical protein
VHQRVETAALERARMVKKVRLISVPECEQRASQVIYLGQRLNQSSHMVSSVTLDPHPIIKQAGMATCATSNAALDCVPVVVYDWSVNSVFTHEFTNHDG